MSDNYRCSKCKKHDGVLYSFDDIDGSFCWHCLTPSQKKYITDTRCEAQSAKRLKTIMEHDTFD